MVEIQINGKFALDLKKKEEENAKCMVISYINDDGVTCGCGVSARRTPESMPVTVCAVGFCSIVARARPPAARGAVSRAELVMRSGLASALDW